MKSCMFSHVQPFDRGDEVHTDRDTLRASPSGSLCWGLDLQGAAGIGFGDNGTHLNTPNGCAGTGKDVLARVDI